MNILDEQIPGEQRQLLKSWRCPVRHIGYDMARKDMQDDEIITLLLSMRSRPFLRLILAFTNTSSAINATASSG